VQADIDWKYQYYRLRDEVEQVLGKALGYPWYKDDQKNFPGTTVADGVCVGDHVPESLLDEAARRILGVRATEERQQRYEDMEKLFKAAEQYFIDNGKSFWVLSPVEQKRLVEAL